MGRNVKQEEAHHNDSPHCVQQESRLITDRHVPTVSSGRSLDHETGMQFALWLPIGRSTFRGAT